MSPASSGSTHPGHRAGLRQEHARADQRVHRSDVAALIDGRRRQPAARGDHRRASRTRSSRTTSCSSRPSWRRGGRGSGSCRATRPSSRTPLVAPFSSGYPADDRSAWPAFLSEYRMRTPTCGLTDVLSRARAPASPTGARPRVHARVPGPRPVLVPRRSRLRASEPLGPNWHRLDSTVRAARRLRGFRSTSRSARAARLPVTWRPRLGGCRADAASVRPAGRTEHGDRVEGPLADQITLHDNMTGEAFLPQPAIMPRVDLVITTATTTRSRRRSITAGR